MTRCRTAELAARQADVLTSGQAVTVLGLDGVPARVDRANLPMLRRLSVETDRRVALVRMTHDHGGALAALTDFGMKVRRALEQRR